jgi:hypothetical protein
MSNLLFMIPKILLFLEMSKLTPTYFEMSKLVPTAFKMSKLATTAFGMSKTAIRDLESCCFEIPINTSLKRNTFWDVDFSRNSVWSWDIKIRRTTFWDVESAFSGLHKNKALLGRRGFSQGRVCQIGFRVLRNHHPPVANDPASRFGFSIRMTEISTNMFFSRIMMGTWWIYWWAKGKEKKTLRNLI